MEKSDFLSRTMEELRANFNLEESLELISIFSLIGYLDQDKDYSIGLDMDALLKEENNITYKLEEVLGEIEREIPYFKNVFSIFNVLQKINAAQLSRFIYSIKIINMDSLEYIDWFDLIIIKYHGKSGRNEGVHTSPKTVNSLAIAILSPVDGSFYDGVSGLGGGLIEAIQYSNKRNGNLDIFAQESYKKAFALSKIRIFISGFNYAKITEGDIFSTPNFKTGNTIEKFDYVYMDPPFGLSIYNYSFIKHDPYNRFFYGIPPRNNGDLAYISHAIASLKKSGKAIVIATEGALFRGGANATIRKNMIYSDIIEAVISLPSKLYEHTNVPVNLLLFNKNKDPERRNKVLFVNAQDCFTEEGRSKRCLSADAVNKITDTVKAGKEINEFSTFVNVENVIDGNLLPNRYLIQTKMNIAGFGNVKFDIEGLGNINTIPLKNKVTFFSGFNVVSKNKEGEQGKYKIVKISDVQDGKLQIENIARYDIDNNAHIEKYRLFKDDIILSTRGSSLKVAITPENDGDMLLSQNFIGIRCGSNLNPKFLKMYLESPLGQFLLTNKLSGTTISTLSKKDVEILEIPQISIDNQNLMMEEYQLKQKQIELEIARLEQELTDVKSNVFDQMGISGVYEIGK